MHAPKATAKRGAAKATRRKKSTAKARKVQAKTIAKRSATRATRKAVTARSRRPLRPPIKATQNGPARKRHQLVTTGKGRLKFPFLIVPDTKFDKDGKFRTDFIQEEADAAPLIKTLGKLHKEALASAEREYNDKLAKASPAQRKKIAALLPQDFFTNEEEGGEPTGNIIFKFGTKAKLTITDKNGDEKAVQRVIPLYDTKGHRITGDDLQVWGGTLAKISFFALPYYVPATGFCGLSLRLAAVQIIDLVSGGGANRKASEFGFGQEDGYEFEEPKDTTPAKVDNEAQDEGGASNLDDEIPF